MAELYISKRDSRPRRRSRSSSLCSACGFERDNAMDILGRSTWSATDRGRRNLSIEVDGREGRLTRQRHTSGDHGGSRTTAFHCYIVPLVDRNAPAPKSTTYREAFRSYPVQNTTRRVRPSPLSPQSSPTSPTATSPTSSSLSRSTPPSPSTREPNSFAQLSEVPTRFHNGNANAAGLKTNNGHVHAAGVKTKDVNVHAPGVKAAYSDHITWMS